MGLHTHALGCKLLVELGHREFDSTVNLLLLGQLCRLGSKGTLLGPVSVSLCFLCPEQALGHEGVVGMELVRVVLDKNRSSRMRSTASARQANDCSVGGWWRALVPALGKVA
ncbi:hypothetical protein [Mesorhizobium sp. BR-1-1-10]|uniref:hypothetical protein n=1 Tax=Mesorhizobium sp. BR-1-1-10 TaxID=2876660 RepID=UPI001CD1771A|nr:hypothetical protein [Mesorhizobium sp. BR-1-1-10]MBZ9977587.1 hypothetical protein [Mesorhizobium sp. BR-1-1-10]